MENNSFSFLIWLPSAESPCTAVSCLFVCFLLVLALKLPWMALFGRFSFAKEFLWEASDCGSSSLAICCRLVASWEGACYSVCWLASLAEITCPVFPLFSVYLVCR